MDLKEAIRIANLTIAGVDVKEPLIKVSFKILVNALSEEPLLPCPFCGSEDVEYEFSSSQGYIKCNTCEAMGAEVEEAADPECSVGAAIVAWNTRSGELKCYK